MREAVATEEGRIIKIGPYWVGLLGKSGVYYSYLHMNPNRLFVKLDDQVSAGQTLGLVSDYMPGPHGTTTHLHFEIHIPVASADGGATFDIVEPYMSLVRSYQRLISSQ
jgi:murein DD-endopeptidase MepM/ murein hydrolase activator NlpD